MFGFLCCCGNAKDRKDNNSATEGGLAVNDQGSN